MAVAASPPDWRKSEAKVHLRKLIVAGTTDNLSAKEVYDLCPELFHQYEYKRFQTNLRNLRKSHEEKSIDESGKKPPSWQKSKAKDYLLEILLQGGDIERMSEEEIYNLSPLFKEYKFLRFKTNLKNLRDTISKDRELVAFDEKAIANDNNLYPPAIGRWDGSLAQRLLKQSVKDKEHQGYKPKALHQTDVAYQQFPLDVFRKHIYQEERALKETSYWLSKRKKDEKKKKK
jgi:hypothetical protein